MKTSGAKRIAVLTVLAFLILLTVMAVIKKLDNIRSYNEAEPLVQLIWPLAQTMKEYKIANGVNATSLLDLVTYSGSSQYLELVKYRPLFKPDDRYIFVLMANQAYGFAVSDKYKPGWLRED